MGMCRLHCDSETLGLTLQLHALTCLVCTPVTGDTRRLFEAGRVDVGLVQGDIALREPKDCVPQRQLAFLRRADTATRRLWFLWDEGAKNHSHGGVALSCGCWGGCQFLDGSIQRCPPQSTTTSAVYATVPSEKTGTLSWTFALHSLKKTLQSVCFRDLACTQLIHKGLLDYYDKRYPSVGEASPCQPSAGSDNESFVSARASPGNSGSQSDTNEFYSLENVNEAGLEGHSLPEQLWRKPRSSTETAGMKNEVHTLFHMLAEEDTLHPLLPSYVYRCIPFYISTKAPSLQSQVRV